MMGGGEGHYSVGHGMPNNPGHQGQGSHKMLGAPGHQGPGAHHNVGNIEPHQGGGPDHNMHKGSQPPGHLTMNLEHMGHKGAPPPPHHAPNSSMESTGAVMPGMPMHSPHMQGHMPMPQTFISPYHMGPGMVPGGHAMMSTAVYPGMPGRMGNGGVATMVPYPYTIPIGAPGAPGVRPQFFQGMGMPVPIAMMPMEPPRMGPVGSGNPAGGKGVRGQRPERRDGYSNDMRHQHHVQNHDMGDQD